MSAPMSTAPGEHRHSVQRVLDSTLLERDAVGRPFASDLGDAGRVVTAVWSTGRSMSLEDAVDLTLAPTVPAPGRTVTHRT
jgi:hypothetical protein